MKLILLLNKLCDPSKLIRESLHQIIKQIANIYFPEKIFPFLIPGLASKHKRQKVECLDEISQMIDTFGSVE